MSLGFPARFVDIRTSRPWPGTPEAALLPGVSVPGTSLPGVSAQELGDVNRRDAVHQAAAAPRGHGPWTRPCHASPSPRPRPPSGHPRGRGSSISACGPDFSPASVSVSALVSEMSTANEGRLVPSPHTSACRRLSPGRDPPCAGAVLSLSLRLIKPAISFQSLNPGPSGLVPGAPGYTSFDFPFSRPNAFCEPAVPDPIGRTVASVTYLRKSSKCLHCVRAPVRPSSATKGLCHSPSTTPPARPEQPLQLLLAESSPRHRGRLSADQHLLGSHSRPSPRFSAVPSAPSP